MVSEGSSSVAVSRLLIARLLSLQGTGAGHRLRAQASVVVAHGSVVWAARLQSTGSIAGAPQLSCSAACGIFLDREWNLCLLHWQETTAWYSETKQLGKFVCISGEEMGRIKRRVMVALI